MVGRQQRVNTPTLPIGRATAREFILFSGSSATFQASRLIVQVLAAAILQPAAFGVWGVAVVALSYATQANIGLLSGANRRIPLLLGAGKREDAARVEQVALSGSVIAGVVAGIAALTIGVVLGGSWTGVGAALGVAILAQQIYLFYQVSLRGRLEFDLASAQQFALAVLFIIVGSAGVVAGGVVGLIVAQAIAYAAGSIVAALSRRGLRPAWDPSLLRSLMREGTPIMMSGLVFAAATSIDRWVVASAGDQAALGHYSFASTISGSLLFISLVVAQQYYPRMAMRHGAGAPRAELERTAWRQGGLALALMVPVAIVIIVGSPFVIPLFLPAYQPAIPAMQLTAIAYMVLSAGSGFTNLLVSIGRGWWLLWLQVGATLVGTLLAWGSLQAGFGLAGVAGAMIVSFGLLTTLAIVAGHRR